MSKFALEGQLYARDYVQDGELAEFTVHLSNNDWIHLQFDKRPEHPQPQSMHNKRVRVTIEVIEDEQKG